MYTDTQQSIRNSLWNFMGSIMNASASDEIKKQNVTALMSEEMCKFCKIDESKLDMSVAKPILKSAVWILEARKLEMSSISIKTEAINNAIEELSNLIASLNSYIERIHN